MVKLDSPNILEQFQLYQQQYQTILLQKEQIRFQQLEIEKALEELEASKSEKAYKITGPIMIKKDTEDLKKELQEKKEDMDLRLKTLTRAEERVAKKLQEMEDDLKKMIKKWWLWGAVMSKLEPIVKLLVDVAGDRTVPRNIRAVVEKAKNYLEDEEKDVDVKLSSAISALDEITNDPNIPMYTRTQIWNIVSMLESVKHEVWL